MIKSTFLKSGDTIGLVTPAGPITEEKLSTAITNLEGLGFKVSYGRDVLLKDGYLAGRDEQRLDSLHKMYDDPLIHGIWCIRGGYGTTRYLDQLDFKLIKKNKKPLIGYSDITALLNTIYQKTKSPCFHGPVCGTAFTDYTIEHLKPIFGLRQSFTIHPSKENDERGTTDTLYQYKSLIPGIATGKLVGGNLSLVSTLIGTKHQIKTKNKLIFLEDVGEDPYRIDRMLTQLINADFFTKSKGVILGVFAGCERDNEKSWTLSQMLADRFSVINKPACYGFSFGHIKHQCTFPIGINATLNTEKRTVTLHS